MKRIALATLALPFTFALAFAQGVYISPGGVGVDTGMGADKVVREYQDEEGCTVRVIQHNRGNGDVVTRQDRQCD